MAEMMANKLASAIQRFEKLIEQTIADGYFPGAAVAFVVDGKTVHAAGYGMADSKNNIPVTPTQCFVPLQSLNFSTLSQRCNLSNKENSTSTCLSNRLYQRFAS